ncbi:hypothetical protein MKW92_023632, partial [Papaver armeniacum]
LANDAQGRGIVEELEADGVYTSHLVVSKDGNSPFTYIIYTHCSNPLLRTCIHTPGYPPMVPDDMTQSSLMSALDGARIVYSDVRFVGKLAVKQGEEKNARRRNIPILVDAEKKRDGLDELLNFADYVPLQFESALVSMLMRLPNLKFVIVTLGDDGCIMLERSLDVLITSSRSPPPRSLQPEEVDVDSSLQLLKQRVDGSSTIPTCISSKSVVSLSAGASCRALGARTGLPWRTDPRITPHLL